MKPPFTRRLLGVGIGLGLVLAVVLLGPRPSLDEAPPLADLSELDLPRLAARIEAAEAAIPGLRPDAHKTIVFADPAAPRKTPLALVFFHGYAASRREFDPVLQRVGQRLGANLFFTRFAGHGFVGPDGHRGVQARDWLADCAEALAVGRALGERVVLVGSSTGATLALWASAQAGWEVDGLVLVSPNFGPKDPRAGLLNWPWSFLLVKALLGDYRSFTPHNERHREAWDITHHTDSLLPMAAAVQAARALDPAQITTPVLVLYHPQDPAVNHDITRELFSRWASPFKQIEESRLGPPNDTHVLAGDLLSPDGTPILEDLILRFVERLP